MHLTPVVRVDREADCAAAQPGHVTAHVPLARPARGTESDPQLVRHAGSEADEWGRIVDPQPGLLLETEQVVLLVRDAAAAVAGIAKRHPGHGRTTGSNSS